MRTYVDHVPEHFLFSPARRPVINAKHIDGPVLYFRDGQMHWLTLWERFLFAIGLTDADAIERKRRPKLVAMLK